MMRVTTFTSRELGRHTGTAKKATQRGPVIIADRGQPAHVLLTIKEYRALTGQTTLLDAIASSSVHTFDFKPPRSGKGLFKPANLV